MDERDGHKSWLPEERLLLPKNYDLDSGRSAATVKHLTDMFKLLSVIRWGISVEDPRQGLYGLPKMALLRYPDQMVQSIEDLIDLQRHVKGVSFDDVIRPAYYSVRNELVTKVSESEIVKIVAKLWREPPTLEGLRKFIAYLYSHYNKKLIRQALITSVDGFQDASRVDRNGIFNPFQVRILADSHQIFHDSLWLVDTDLEREIQENGYSMP